MTWQVGSSIFGSSKSVTALSNPDLRIVASVDLDRNGKAELLVRNNLSNTVELGDLSSQTYSRLSTLPDRFEGVIVGNEVLLRREQPPAALKAMIERVRAAMLIAMVTLTSIGKARALEK